MRKRGLMAGIVAVLALAISLTAMSAAQTPHAAPAAANPAQKSAEDVSELQDQLLEHLRVSPTLAEVVAHDPSLLSNPEYVKRSNPELAAFLQEHPEIAQNPDFYLFNNLHGQNEQPSETLERKLWPQMSPRSDESVVARDLVEGGLPLLAFISFLGVVLWLTQVLLENRRWNRIFKLQSDVHGKLIERFGTSQEVLTYMNTDSGKRFLEATPISVGLDRGAPVPSHVARILTPMQIGIVLSLLGVGLVLLRHSIPGGEAPLLLVGTVVLMPGLGFIISSVVTWALARHLGLMPQAGIQTGEQS